MTGSPLSHRCSAAWSLAFVLASAAALPGSARAQPPAAATAVTPAAAAASGPRVSPYVLAAQRRAEELASEPLKVNPLMKHRSRKGRATGRG